MKIKKWILPTPVDGIIIVIRRKSRRRNGWKQKVSLQMQAKEGKKRKKIFSCTAAYVQMVPHIRFLVGFFFSAQPNILTFEYSRLSEIFSNQMAIPATKIWHSYLLAKTVGRLRTVSDLKLAFPYNHRLLFCHVIKMSKNVPNRKNKVKSCLQASIFCLRT